jgi:hypothetical protein
MKHRARINQEGDRRTKTRFLFFPRTIYNDGYAETRWLCKATWEEEYTTLWSNAYWSAVRWL